MKMGNRNYKFLPHRSDLGHQIKGFFSKMCLRYVFMKMKNTGQDFVIQFFCSQIMVSATKIQMFLLNMYPPVKQRMSSL